MRGLMCSRSLGWGSSTAEEDALGGTAAAEEPSPEKRLARLNLLPPPPPPPSSFITRCDEVSRRRPGGRRRLPSRRLSLDGLSRERRWRAPVAGAKEKASTEVDEEEEATTAAAAAMAATAAWNRILSGSNVKSVGIYFLVVGGGGGGYGGVWRARGRTGGRVGFSFLVAALRYRDSPRRWGTKTG